MTYKIRSLALATAFGLLALPAAAFAQDTQADDAANIPASFRLSTGVTYSSGSYGELEDTEVFAVPISATYSDDGLRIRISVPWVRIDGPGSLLSTPEGRDNSGSNQGGSGDSSNSGSSNSGSGSSNSGSSGSSGGSGGGSSSGGGEVEVEDELADDVINDDNVVDSGGFAGVDDQRSGFGDINIFASYSFDLGGGLYLDPSVKLKLPTASLTQRLGTGEVDVTLATDLVQEVGPATFYIHGRRKFTGQPTGSTVRSTWGAGGGVSLSAGNGVAFGADYDWQQSAFLGRSASSEVSGWINFRLLDGVSLTTYAGTGLNANSADVFGGATIGLRF